jgi:uncharacterized protein (TIGR03000 family)
MKRLAMAMVAGGALLLAFGPVNASPQKGKGGGKGGGGAGPARGIGGIPPGQVRNAVLGTAFGPGGLGGFYQTPFFYNDFYSPYVWPGYAGTGFWPGTGFGGLTSLPYYYPLGGYSPSYYYYTDGTILPYYSAGTYAAPVPGWPSVLNAPAVPAQTVQQPTPAPAPMPSPTEAAPVHVTVRVPDGAQVWLADAPSNQTGTSHEFVSPPVEPGVDYTYVVRAAWTENGQPVNRTKRVVVRAGDRVTVDMTQPD